MRADFRCGHPDLRGCECSVEVSYLCFSQNTTMVPCLEGNWYHSTNSPASWFQRLAEKGCLQGPEGPCLGGRTLLLN